MIIFPNSKVNIGLNITEKRPDGFHNIESIFYPIQLCDSLEIIESERETKFTSSGISIPGNGNDNLCIKAYNLIKQDYEIPEVKIHLHKQIPIGAGLGGGSADASCTLKLINDIFELNISNENLKNYARKLGSDCAFFIDNNPAFAYNKGDEFEKTSIDLSGYFFLLINPGIHVSTADAYSGVTTKMPENNLNKLIDKPIESWKNLIKNDFEDSVFKIHPKINEIKNDLYNSGATYASMSGSGSSLFGIFKDKPKDISRFDNYFSWSTIL